MYEFRAMIEKAGSAANSWCFVTVPPEIAEALAGARRITGTMAGQAFEGALLARGRGVKSVLVKRELRDALGLAPGHEIVVALKADEAPRQVTVPAELTAALEQRPAVALIFAQLAPSHQREYASWIAEAKRPQTRTARIDRALTMIAQKHHVK
jgi:hypothetical protein